MAHFHFLTFIQFVVSLKNVKYCKAVLDPQDHFMFRDSKKTKDSAYSCVHS